MHPANLIIKKENNHALVSITNVIVNALILITLNVRLLFLGKQRVLWSVNTVLRTEVVHLGRKMLSYFSRASIVIKL